MRPQPFMVLACLVFLAAPAQAHGSLAVNELETLAIRDFEGQEDSFPWEGFEIWDVYVGDGYNDVQDSDGVYFKVNFAGDGTKRPTGSAAWTLTFTFTVGEDAFQRQLTHDGADVTSDFEALEWTIADGNVLQVRAWVPVPQWQGKAVRDIVIVSAVDGEPRDTAPGGIHVPGSGTEVPVEGPGTGVFPPLGEGRIVDEVPLTGPAKFLDVTATPVGAGAFEVVVKNPLKEQGQHVLLREPVAAEWTIATSTWAASLEGEASATFAITLTPPANGTVQPLPLDFYTDIGGRQTHYAYLDAGEVKLTSDPAAARPTTIAEPAQDASGLGAAALLAALSFVAVAVLRRRTGP